MIWGNRVFSIWYVELNESRVSTWFAKTDREILYAAAMANEFYHANSFKQSLGKSLGTEEGSDVYMRRILESWKNSLPPNDSRLQGIEYMIETGRRPSEFFR